MLNLLFIAMGYVIIQMICVWILYRMTDNPSIVDVAWPIGLVITGLIYLWSSTINFRLTIISLILICWGIRLGTYLWVTRIRKSIIDKRYLKLSENWVIAKPLGFFLNFQLQGFFILIISSVFLFAGTASNSAMSWVDCLGTLLAIIGIIGETLADYQLYTFQQDNKGKVCDSGLWQYSRHPNYFFEWLIWCGFSLYGLQHHFGYISFISPVFLFIILIKITGPMTEKGSISSRGEAYLAYQRITPMFFPGILSKKSSSRLV